MSGSNDPTGDEENVVAYPSSSRKSIPSTTLPNHAFKRPFSPPVALENEHYERAVFTPHSRPKTPLCLTEIKSRSKLSDCVIPTVQLGPHLQEVAVTFGSTYLHKPITRYFKVENLEDSPFHLEANISPLKEAGFLIDFEEVKKSRDCRIINRVQSPTTALTKTCLLEIFPKKTVAIPVDWLPTKIGKVRVSVPFNSKGFSRGFKLILTGQVVFPPVPTQKIRGKDPKPLSTGPVKRPLKAITRSHELEHAEPHNSVSSTPDRLKRLRAHYKVDTSPRELGWLTESNHGFAELLNFTLISPSFEVGTQLLRKSHAWFSYTWEKLYLLAKGRRLLRDRELIAKFTLLRQKLNQREIRLKREFNVINNVGLRRRMVELFCEQIDSLWLVFALELVLNQTGTFASCLDKSEINELVEECFFNHVHEDSNPIKAEARLLEKAIGIMIYLDTAKGLNILASRRRLFIRDSEIRSTQSFLGKLKSMFLETHEFSISLRFIQTSHDEVDLYIVELAKDLRDGVKLCHLASLLTQDYTSLPALRVPAATHQARVDNQCLMFDLLDQHGIVTSRIIGGPTRPCDIADGDRKKTLGLLWTIGLRWQLPKLINSAFFASEIARLQLRFLRQFGTPLDEMATETSYFASPLMSGLLTWVATVAAFFELKVSNFTSCFEDGRALCYLIAYYFPRLLPPTSILGPPTQEPAVSTGIHQAGWKIYSPPKRQKLTSAREAVRHNFDLFKRVVVQLGQVPSFVSFRVDGAIDERLVVLYVAHLAHRICALMTLNRCACLIQAWWRSKSYAHDSAAWIIQRALRAFQARQQNATKSSSFHSVRQAAIRIQALWRRRVAQEAFQRLLHSITLVQTRFRAKLQRSQFLKFRVALRSTQRLCRGLLARKTLARARSEHSAAIKIQTFLRACFDRLRYNLLHQAVRKIQMAWRCKVESRIQHLTYTQQKQAVITLQKIRRRVVAKRDFLHQRNLAARKIQAMYRGKLAQRTLMTLKSTHHAVVSIQSWIKGYLARSQFFNLKAAALHLQDRRRSAILTRAAMIEFQTLRNVACLIQARFRFMTHLREQAQLQSRSAILIQAQVRRFLKTKELKTLLNSILVIQARRRALVIGRYLRQRYLIVQHGISSVQALARRHLHIERVKLKSVITIQSIWRSYLARTTLCLLQSQKKAAEFIQALVRGYLMRNQRKKVRHATTFIQHRRRSCVAVRKLLKAAHTGRLAAIEIQQFWRHQKLGYAIRCDYAAIKEAAVLVTRRRRQLTLMRGQRQEYVSLKAATIYSQRSYRHAHSGKTIRNRFLQQKQAATVVQARRRGAVLRSEYNSLCDKVRIICQRRRSTVTTRSLHGQYIETKRCITFVQTLFRHKQYGDKVRSDFLSLKSAAIIVQCMRRTWVAKRFYTKLREAATLIAQRRRQFLHARECQSQYSALKYATVVIQQRWRATKLQRVAQEKYHLMRAYFVTIQAFWRGHSIRAQIRQLKYAVGVIAQARRCAVLSRELRAGFLNHQHAAIVLQRWYRHIQLGQQVRQRYLQERTASITIQALWRQITARKAYFDIVRAANVVAMRRRQALLTSEIHREYSNLRTATIQTQAMRRMSVLRSQFFSLRRAGSVIAHRRRCAVLAREACAQYKILKCTVVAIQQRYRLVKYGQAIHREYLTSRKAAVTIQSLWRMATLRTDFEWLRWATILTCRRRRQVLLARETRQLYLSIKFAAIVIQRRYRLVRFGDSIKKEYLVRRAAAIQIQASWRMIVTRSNYLRLRDAASFIATSRKNIVLTRSALHGYLTQKWAATVFQQKFRAVMLGRAVKGNFKDLKSSAITIQSYFRGYIARTDYLRLKYTATLISQRRRYALHAREARARYLTQRSAAVTLQSCTRMRFAQTRYQLLRWAVTIISQRWRGIVLARNTLETYRDMYQASLLIQKHRRMVMERTKYLQLREAANLVTGMRRQLLLTRYTHQQYSQLRACAVFVQQRYRLIQYGKQVQEEFKTQRIAVIKIQTAWRCVDARSSFIRLNWAANLISQRRRQLVYARETHQQYLQARHAAITIQQYYRLFQFGKIIREDYKLKRRSAITIQTAWRCANTVSSFLSLKRAANLIAQRRTQLLLTRYVNQQYLTLRACAIFIQQRYRLVTFGRSVRMDFEAMQKSAIRIQTAWRCIDARSSFIELKRALNIVSQRRKQLVISRVLRQQYLCLYYCAVYIQQRYRLIQFGRSVREDYEAKRRSAIKLQATWRCVDARSFFLRLKGAADVVSRRRRQLFFTRDINQQYLQTRNAAVAIQHFYRHIRFGRSVREDFDLKKSSAISIQTLWRCIEARSFFLWLKWAANLVAQRRIQLLITRDTLQQYRTLRACAIFIQKRYRLIQLGKSVCEGFELKKRSAISIQTVWRCIYARSSFLWLKWAADLVAQRRRQLITARDVRQNYLAARHAAIAIQRSYRLIRFGRSVREDYEVKRRSAIVIQTAWRYIDAKSSFLWLKWAANVVSQRRKQLLNTRDTNQRYLQIRQATVTIQQYYRLFRFGRIIRENYELIRRSAITIQTAWRCANAISSFLSLKRAANLIAQRRTQLLLTRYVNQQYLTLRACAIFIQQRYRLVTFGRSVRMDFEAMQKSAIQIQAVWRAVHARKEFVALRRAATTISQYRRQALEATLIHQQYIQTQSAAVFLQGKFRAIQLSRATQAKYNSLKSSIISIQAHWRRVRAKSVYLSLKRATKFVAQRRRQLVQFRDTRHQYLQLQGTASVLQGIYRKYQLGKRTREWYTRMRNSAIIIQAYWRRATAQVDYEWLIWAGRVVVRRRQQLLLAREIRAQFLSLKAATIFIQRSSSHYRQCVAIRDRYVHQRKSCIRIQAIWRAYCCRKEFGGLIRATNRVAERRRALVLGRLVRHQFCISKLATVFIQQTFRNYRLGAGIRNIYLIQKAAAVKIQSLWKRLVSRSSYLWLQWAASVVAKRRKCALQAREERMQFITLGWSVTTSQRLFRHYRACALVRAQYMETRNATITIQRTLREYWHRQSFMNISAIKLQTYWRCHQAHTRYLLLKEATTIISAAYRGTIARREFVQLRSAAMAIQHRWRNTQCAIEARSEYQRIQAATRLVQRLYRQRVRLLNTCATRIQKAWRLKWQLISLRALVAHKWSIRLRWKMVTTKIISLIILYRHFKEMSNAVRYSKNRLISITLATWREKCDAKLAAIREAQLAQRRSESATLIQTACRGYLARRWLWAAQTIAIRIQCLYRGHLVRKNSNAKVRKACRGVVRACREAQPHMLLSYRTTLALDILSNSHSLTRIIHACEHLVVVTQLSSLCRQRLIHQYRVIQIILQLMRSCNRSQPHQEILRHAVIILENISRDPNCDWGMYVTPKEVDDLVVTMLDHKDLNHILKSLMVTLSYLVNHSVGFQSVLQTSQVLTRLRMVQSSMLRNQRRYLNPPPSYRTLLPRPCNFTNYSIGLVGLSSFDSFDQIEMMNSFIRLLVVHPTADVNAG